MKKLSWLMIIMLFVGCDGLWLDTRNIKHLHGVTLNEGCPIPIDGEDDSAADGTSDGTIDGQTDDGITDGTVDSADDSTDDGTSDGQVDAADDGSADSTDGTVDGSTDGTTDGTTDGSVDSSDDGREPSPTPTPVPTDEEACLAAGKTYLCHIPRGNPENLSNICIANEAAPAHLAHNDYLGQCQ